jgi:lysine 2,3-aminomutase
MGDWPRELARRITRPEELPSGFVLQAAERAYFTAPADPAGGRGRLPFAVTRHYASLADPADAQDPIRRQFVPRLEELERGPGELPDPLGEQDCQPVPKLLHRYPDRALLLVTDLCATYCRHCFRRRSTGQAGWVLSAAQAEAAAAYVASHREIRELILSGGDPLMLGDAALQAVLRVFRAARPELSFRIHTRLPVVLPERVSEDLVELLRGYRPLRLVTQINHPRELSAPTRAAVQRLAAAGVGVLNQAVLLRGVNDRLETLVELMRALGEAGIQPYYLFQPDLAEGTAHFRPALRGSLSLVRALRRRLPRALVPAFAVDLPGGGGKVRLDGRRPPLRGGCYRLRGGDGREAREARYPAD